MKSKSTDVKWYLPHSKKCFAGSTVATSDLIVILSEEFLTTKDVYESINYDQTAKEILKHFIDNGYGNFILEDIVHINPSRVYRKIENGEIIDVPFEELKKHLDIPTKKKLNIAIKDKMKRSNLMKYIIYSKGDGYYTGKMYKNKRVNPDVCGYPIFTHDKKKAKYYTSFKRAKNFIENFSIKTPIVYDWGIIELENNEIECRNEVFK